MIEILYVILGILVFFIPGYLLSLILYPGREDLDFWERIGTSVGLGALIVVLILTILAQPGIRALEFFPFLASIILFCAVCGFFITYRRGLDRLLEFLRRAREEEPVREEHASEE